MPGPDPLAGPAVSVSPSAPAASAGGKSGSKEPLQIPAPVATWRALLEAPRYGGNLVHVGDVDLSVWRTDAPSRACVIGSLAGCAIGSLACVETASRSPLSLRAERGSAPPPPCPSCCISIGVAKLWSIKM